MADNKKVAERLVHLRGERSLESVAEAVGVSISALSMYEHAQRMPRDEVKCRIAAFYNQPVQAIFYDD